MTVKPVLCARGETINYFYFDIETCPINKEKYLSKEAEERKKLLNPIDSRIIAIGIKQSGKDALILCDEDEKNMLDAFWVELAAFRKGDPSNKIVGFNVKNFDLPFVVTRSFINEVEIVPFLLKDIVDLRENISAFTFGHTRGKLKEFASFMGIKIVDDIDGEKVAEQYWAGNIKKILEYLEKDLEITEKMNERMVALRINEIQRW
ncbi:MAG: ribonuclease H-like domain-containing protein [archaeon]